MEQWKRTSGDGAENEPDIAKAAFDLAVDLLSLDGSLVEGVCESALFEFAFTDRTSPVRVFIAVACGDGRAGGVVTAHNELHRQLVSICGGRDLGQVDTTWERQR